MVMPLSTSADVSLTILTPTYNRAEFLPKVFSSITSQLHDRDLVEWLVIDDGSTDGTQHVLDGFRQMRPGLVRSIKTKNGGKHRAINRAALTARGEWLMIIDSDDHLVDGALRKVLETTSFLTRNESVGVIRALKRFPQFPRNDRFCVRQNPCRYADWANATRGFDAAEVIRVSALRQHRFPDFPGERFMAEGWLWHSLDRTHLTYYVNEEWIECYYQQEGISASSRQTRAASPRGAMAVYEAMLSANPRFGLRARAATNWWRYYFHAKRQSTQSCNAPPASRAFLLAGWLASLSDRAVIRLR
jgi:glycosyltransferase involved in cell wall biosynthesis